MKVIEAPVGDPQTSVVRFGGCHAMLSSVVEQAVNVVDCVPRGSGGQGAGADGAVPLGASPLEDDDELVDDVDDADEQAAMKSATSVRVTRMAHSFSQERPRRSTHDPAPPRRPTAFECVLGQMYWSWEPEPIISERMRPSLQSARRPVTQFL